MRVINSGSTPNPAAATTSRATAPAPGADRTQATGPAPAATVEISSAARRAASAGQGRASGSRPVSIIWADRSSGGGRPVGK